MDKRQQEIISIYKKLGDRYLSDISKYEPPHFGEFISLFPKKSKILEAGCAGGRDTKKLVEKGFDVIGIDLMEDFLAKARKDVPKAEFRKMDLLKLDFAKDSFDGILAFAVLLHIDKQKIPQVLKNFNKILKPDGLLYVGVKRGGGTKKVVDRLSQNTERRFSFFYKNEMEDLVKRSGFKVIESGLFPDPAGRENLKWVCLWARKK